MKTIVALLGVLIAGGIADVHAEEAETAPAPRPGIANCEVFRPSGDYALVQLALTIPGDPKNTDRSNRVSQIWTYVGGVRGGKMRVDDGIGLREPGGWLEVRNDELTGRFRRVDLAADVSIAATIADDTITGSAMIGDEKATATGRYVPEAELAKRNAIARDESWPASQGPPGGGCSAQLTGATTIDDPGQLRLMWRCEESDIGRGMGNITRFMNKWRDATTRRTGSGCASPIVADGKVFFKYFVPAPRPADTPEIRIREYHNLTESSGRQAMLAEAKAAGFKGEQLPPYAVEKVFQNADDIVLCMDAATGKTLWKAVVKDRGLNSQHHKVGPFDMSPAYANGRVFALGMSGWLYAFDAATGQPLWEVEAGYDHSNALLAIGNRIIAPAGREWGCYDATTGQLIWKAGGGRAMSTLSAWNHAGNNYLIGVIGAAHEYKGVSCLDAANGKQLWNLPVKVLTAGRGLGPGGISIFGDRLLVNQDNGTGMKSDPLKPAIAAYRLSLTKPEPLWELGPDEDTARVAALRDSNNAKFGPVHNECVPLVVRGKYLFTADLRVADIETGKVVATTDGVAPANGGYMQGIEDLVLVRRDGTHGNMECGFYKIGEDGSVRSLNPNSPWVPPVGGTTTSYHHPIFYPMVDGRIFLRQENGVYCWDARKP